MPVGRRKIAEENKALRQKLEECQVLLSALALESDGEFTIPADAFVKFSLAIDNEHAFVIERMDNGAIRVRFQPTAQDAPDYVSNLETLDVNRPSGSNY